MTAVFGSLEAKAERLEPPRESILRDIQGYVVKVIGVRIGIISKG